MTNVDHILNIEKEYNLYNDKIEDVNYWIYLRYELLSFYLPRLQGKFEGEAHARLSNKRSFIKKIPALIFNMLFKGKIKAKQADVCIINHERRIWENEHFECKYTQKLHEYYGNNCVNLEIPYNYGHLKPIKETNIVYLDYISILSNIYYLWSRLFKRRKYKDVYHQVENHIKEPFAKIAKCYGTEYQLQDVAEKITRVIFQIKIKKYLLRKLLKIINPKTIIEVVGYSQTCMTINEVAYEMGIPSYELQHGMIGEEHFAYNYANENRIIQFPDYVFVFGQFWKNNIKWPIESEHVLPVGFPYLEEKCSHHNMPSHKGDNKIVLFLSESNTGKRMSILAYQFCNLIKDKRLKVQIIYKLHPGEYLVWKQRYPDLLAASKESVFQVIDTTKSNLYELLSQADIHIGTCSTTIMEGLMWKPQTLIYRVDDIPENVKYLCDNSIAHFIDSAEDILSYLDKVEKKNELDTEYFWKRNAVNNIIQTIQGEFNANNY